MKMIGIQKHFCFILIIVFITYIKAARIREITDDLEYSTLNEPSIEVECKSDSMLIVLKNIQDINMNGFFSGMIYPKDLPKNSTCLAEYRKQKIPLQYTLPLRRCNTMPQESDFGEIEFFNTIIVQPHLKLVTNMGKGFHVRCRYKNRKLIKINEAKKTSLKENDRNSAGNPEAYQSVDDSKSEIILYNSRRNFARSFQTSFSNLDEIDKAVRKETTNNYVSTDLKRDKKNDLPMPGIHMKIYNQDKIAENVHIGEPLKLIINIDEQQSYGLRITHCIVKDGLGWGEQTLIDENGCPTDYEIMGPFNYANDKLSATVTFPAHKFPYTTSVYYQCNVKLCAIKHNQCFKPTICEQIKREKRQMQNKDEDDIPAIIEVYSGLYVNENTDIIDPDIEVTRKKTGVENELCISQRTFAISIAIAGLILMLAIVAAIICIMSKKRVKTLSNSESSIYSGPYTNTAFSHSS